MSELSERLVQIKELTLNSTHAGLYKDKDRMSETDHWIITITYKGQSYTTNYSTGTGLRKLKAGIKMLDVKYQNKYSGDIKDFSEACKAGWVVPVLPNIADVMYCLLSDSSNVDSFEEFCANFGYDEDSRKALNIYLECQKTCTAMIKMLGMALFEELSQLEH